MTNRFSPCHTCYFAQIAGWAQSTALIRRYSEDLEDLRGRAQHALQQAPSMVMFNNNASPRESQGNMDTSRKINNSCTEDNRKLAIVNSELVPIALACYPRVQTIWVYP